MKRWEQRSALPSEQARWRVGVGVDVRPAHAYGEPRWPQAVPQRGEYIEPDGIDTCGRFVPYPEKPPPYQSGRDQFQPLFYLGPPVPPTCNPYPATNIYDAKCAAAWQKYELLKKQYPAWAKYYAQRALADETVAMLALFNKWRDAAYFWWPFNPTAEPSSNWKYPGAVLGTLGLSIFPSFNEGSGYLFGKGSSNIVVIINDNVEQKSLLSEVYAKKAWRWLPIASERRVWGTWFGDPECHCEHIWVAKEFKTGTIPFMFGLNSSTDYSFNARSETVDIPQQPGSSAQIPGCPTVSRDQLKLFVFGWATKLAQSEVCGFPNSLPPMGVSHAALAAKISLWSSTYGSLIASERKKWIGVQGMNCGAWK